MTESTWFSLVRLKNAQTLGPGQHGGLLQLFLKWHYAVTVRRNMSLGRICMLPVPLAREGGLRLARHEIHLQGRYTNNTGRLQEGFVLIKKCSDMYGLASNG